MWQVFQWSFDHGFVSYATQRDRDLLAQMANRTANLYVYYNNWDFLVSESKRELEWQRAKLENMRDLIPPPVTPNLDLIYPSQYYRQRFALFDKDGNPLIGGISLERAETQPVIVNKQTVGFVGLRSMKELVQDQTIRFVRQQGESFLLISAFMLAIAALLTWPLAKLLSRPISEISQATRKLASGDLNTRIQVNGKDELGQLAADFNQLAASLEEAKQARKRWVADTAHELRTPISVLRGEIEAMQDGIIPVTPDSLNSLLQETLHLGRLVEDLNQLSMHDMGNLNYKMAPTNVCEVLKHCMQGMQRTFEEAGIEMNLIVEKKCKNQIMADHDRLSQLFSNLMSNTLKYTNAPGKLDIIINKQANHLEIRMEDSAPGVCDQDKEKIFERFYRIEHSRNRQTGGRGLGLAICRKIIDGHQGKIEAYHSPSGGLGVRIELPFQ